MDDGRAGAVSQGILQVSFSAFSGPYIFSVGQTIEQQKWIEDYIAAGDLGDWLVVVVVRNRTCESSVPCRASALCLCFSALQHSSLSHSLVPSIFLVFGDKCWALVLLLSQQCQQCLPVIC